ncbi:MAG TPA: DUF4126 domain-containing protein [Planctomycetaceae bacterium]|nr:DUF4126 domain-containing protein [Planctomycetaceae bacterium]
MDIALGLIIGIGLSAACGFRLFVPFLVMGLAHRAGQLPLADGFAWIGTMPAIAAFTTATVLEILAYYIPWVDNLLDTITTPSAAVAGTFLAASQLGEASPLMQWSLAAIAGGGTSLTVQGGTAAVRVVSTGTTGGAGNFLVATLEWTMAVFLAILAVVLPLLCLLVISAVLWKMIALMKSRKQNVTMVEV